jgi:hypothetical protein
MAEERTITLRSRNETLRPAVQSAYLRLGLERS